MLKSRFVRFVLPVAVGGLVLTSCGGDSGDGGGTTFKIAYQGPLSGENVALGENMENGVKLAIDQANESGDYDVTFEYAPADDRGEPGQANLAAQKMIDDGDVIAVVGPAFSDAANVAAPTYGQARMTVLSPSATGAELTKQGFQTFLRGVPNDAEQGAAMASFFSSEGVEKAVVIDDTSAYSIGLANVAADSMEEEGIEVQRETVPADTVDHSGAARTVAQSGADGLVYTGYYEQAGPLAVKLNEAGFEGVKLGGDGVRDGELITLAGDASEDWYLSCPCRDLTDDEAGQKFMANYEAAFNREVGTYTPESYDAANMIIKAVAELGESADRASVFEAISADTHEGIAKTLKFDETGEFAGSGVYIFQVTDGEIVSVGNVEDLADE